MFNSENSAELVGIRNYTSSKGEISNQTLNVGIDVLEAKKKDLKDLQNLSIESVYQIADENKISHEIADKAIADLLVRNLKNVSSEIENRTVASQAQSKAYRHLNKGMKVLLESGVLYVSGFAHKKTVLVKGVYKTVNSRDLTIMKNSIEKHLNFRMLKYRNFTFKDAESYKINGNEIIVK